MKREGEAQARSFTPALPPGWASVEVGEVAEVDIGFAFKSAEFSESGIRLLRGENIEPGALRWTDTRYWPKTKLEPFRKLLIEPGDLILAMDRPVVSAGLKLARARGEDCPCLLVQRVARLRGWEGTTDVLHHALSTPGFTKHILVGGQTGTQLPHISGKRIEDFVVRLPPSGEQRRLVEALDSYLSRLDAAAEGLRRVEANLKRYRASVLKAAVEGRLVPTEAELAKRECRTYEPASVLLARILKERRRRWEESELAKMKAKGESPKNDTWKSKYQEPSAPDTTSLPALPEGWCWARAEQLSKFITKGTTPAASEMSEGAGDVPYVKVYNLTFDGSLNFRLDPTFVRRTIHQGPLSRSICYPGDVLTNIVGPPLGKVSLVPGDYPEWNINQAIARLRPIAGLAPEYLSVVLRSENSIRWCEQKAKATAGQFNLTLEIVRDLPIPLPPLHEQHRIVDEEQELLSLEGEWAAMAARSRRGTDRLRQSILTWAFEGKLVDQDPNDEPASALLGRIRALREAGVSSGKAVRPPKKKAR